MNWTIAATKYLQRLQFETSTVLTKTVLMHFQVKAAFKIQQKNQSSTMILHLFELFWL